MGLYVAPTRHVFKMASLAVTWMLSSNLWCTKSQRSGQVYHIVLSREAYYSSQVSTVCVTSVQVEIRALIRTERSNDTHVQEQPTRFIF